MSETPITQDKTTDGQKPILHLYAALGVSLIMSILPNMTAAFLSIGFFLGVFIAAYAIRRKAEEHSFSDNHATFVIRTLWIAALFSLATTAAATAYMMSKIDYGPFQPCANILANKGVEWLESASMIAIYTLTEPCVELFIDFNDTILMNSVFIAGGPIIVYTAYRMAKGLARALKGYRLSDTKSWF